MRGAEYVRLKDLGIELRYLKGRVKIIEAGGHMLSTPGGRPRLKHDWKPGWEQPACPDKCKCTRAHCPACCQAGHRKRFGRRLSCTVYDSTTGKPLRDCPVLRQLADDALRAVQPWLKERIAREQAEKKAGRRKAQKKGAVPS